MHLHHQHGPCQFAIMHDKNGFNNVTSAGKVGNNIVYNAFNLSLPTGTSQRFHRLITKCFMKSN